MATSPGILISLLYNLHRTDTCGEDALIDGAIYAALGALTFALNNVSMRRGVVTGTVLQGMAITVPIGALTFVAMAAAAGVLWQIATFPIAAVAWPQSG